MAIEVEVKHRIGDLAALEAALAALGAKFTPPRVQVDRYYRHPARDFAQTDEALRIRRVGNENFITYKGPKLDQTTKTRHEIELPIAPGETGNTAFASLLEALGFSPVAEVRKSRRQGKLIWQERAVTLALDDVDRVGQFAELELVTDEADLDAARQCVQSLAAKLALGAAERRSYLELLLGQA